MKTLAFAFLSVLPLMCGSNQSDYSVAESVSYEKAYTEEVSEDYNFDSEAEASSPRTTSSEAKIIKTANLTLETQDLEKAKANIEQLNKTYKAVVMSQEEGTNYKGLKLDFTIKVPAQNFDAWLADISKTYPYFDRKNISAADVTEEYMDVESRLKNKKVLEARYLELLKKANQINEILEIEREINKIREEIEIQEGRLKYLKEKVAFSTIYLNVYKTVPAMNHVKESYFTRIISSIKGGWNFMLNLFLGLLYIWPLIIIIIFVIIYFKKRQKAKQNATPKNQST